MFLSILLVLENCDFRSLRSPWKVLEFCPFSLLWTLPYRKMRILLNAYSRLVNLIEDIDKISFAYDSPIERCLLLPNYFGLCCWRCNTPWVSLLWSVAAHTLRTVSHTRAEPVRFEEKRSNRKSKTKSKSVRAAWERSINIDRRMFV